MTQLRWLLHTAASGLVSLGCAGAVAGGFQWVAGQPNALPCTPCLSGASGRMQPRLQPLLHRRATAPLGAAGLGVQRLDIEDHPCRGVAWKPRHLRRLINVPLSEAKGPDVRAVQHSELLPMTAAELLPTTAPAPTATAHPHHLCRHATRVHRAGGFMAPKDVSANAAHRHPHAHHHARSLWPPPATGGRLNDTAAHRAPKRPSAICPACNACCCWVLRKTGAATVAVRGAALRAGSAHQQAQ